MHRPSSKLILTTLGIPVGILAATAAPAAAAINHTARTQQSNSDAVTLWKPPMPCVAVQAGAFPVGSGFCPGATGGLDWNRIAATLRDSCGVAGATAAIHPTVS